MLNICTAARTGFRWRALYGDAEYPEGYEIHGIDISHYQGKIDWEQLKNAMIKGCPVRFVIIKSTEGSSRLDENFRENFNQARDFGFIRGVYHFWSNKSTAREQAYYFLDQVHLTDGDLPPVLDIEHKPADKSVTENTRVSYPINHIENIVRPISSAPAAKNVIFLSADAFGVLPPVSILTPEQTQYYFLSGFTAKLAGTERGITEPTPTFSACFGQAFLELHPTKYAEELVKKMEKSGAKAYLVNTGWNGTGKRISIKDTRGIIDAILNGDIKNVPTKTIPYFNFEVPTELTGVDTGILDPRDTYADASEWDVKAKDLAERFIKNFAKYEGNEAGKALVAAGPQL